MADWKAITILQFIGDLFVPRIGGRAGLDQPFHSHPHGNTHQSEHSPDSNELFWFAGAGTELTKDSHSVLP